jgi:DNA uptake protein ComE-like DNA-binding protein
MKWRDFFYFSKGERRALIVLLSLISVAWLILVLTGEYSRLKGGEKAAGRVFYPVCIYPVNTPAQSVETDSAKTFSPSKKELPKEVSPPAQTPFYRKGPARVEKYSKGTLVELNTADTLILKKVPGIGSAFSNRIVKYRNLLGGFYSVSQLGEVYGIDEERYQELKEWFCVNPELILKKQINQLPADSLSRHPYINYRQAKAIKHLRKQKGKLSGWENLSLLEEFTEFDRKRIGPYFSFE